MVPVGDPDMEVTWLLDDKPLGIANRIHTIFEFGYCSLDIVNCYKCDTGIITCRATNKYGTQETAASLIVKEERRSSFAPSDGSPKNNRKTSRSSSIGQRSFIS